MNIIDIEDGPYVQGQFQIKQVQVQELDQVHQQKCLQDQAWEWQGDTTIKSSSKLLKNLKSDRTKP